MLHSVALQGYLLTGYETQGDVTWLRRSTLPWADMWLPLSGRIGAPRRKREKQDVSNKRATLSLLRAPETLHDVLT